MNTLLKFGQGNAKLGKFIATFSTPAGHTCPGAKDCLAMANRQTGKLTVGKDTQFRCFSASMETLFPKMRDARWHNFEQLKSAKTVTAMARLISDSLPKGASVVRVHVGGDFFNESYFKAWMNVASSNPNILFYAYTKMINFWVQNILDIPKNFVLTASRGGKYDHLIVLYVLKNAEVVYSFEEAKRKGLRIDHDDSLARDPNVKQFALLIHGKQQPGSKASTAMKLLRKQGVFGYGNKKNKKVRVVAGSH